MKKWVIFLVLVLGAGGAVLFLRPQLVRAESGKSGTEPNKATPAHLAQQLWAKAKAALGSVAMAKSSERGAPRPNRSLKIIQESSPGVSGPASSNSTNSPTEHDPIIQAGLKALNQLSVRGIVVSGNRSSAVIQTGRQTAPVFVGDVFSVKTPDGLVTLRCEKIDRRTVWFRIPETPVLAELRLP